MSEWGWVAFGYSIFYALLLSYIGWTVFRLRRGRRRLGSVR